MAEYLDNINNDHTMHTIKVEATPVIKQELDNAPHLNVGPEELLKIKQEAIVKSEQEEYFSVDEDEDTTNNSVKTEYEQLNDEILIKHEAIIIKSEQEEFSLVDEETNNESSKHKREQFKHKTRITKHLESKPFKCDQCNYSGNFYNNLKMHIQIKHIETKKSNTFKCTQCDYSFLQKHRLKDHILTKHIRLKPFKCAHCDYACSINKYLKMHMQSKHKELYKEVYEEPIIKFKCERCDRWFKKNDSLVRHVLIKHSERNEARTDEINTFKCAASDSSYKGEVPLMKTYIKKTQLCNDFPKFFDAFRNHSSRKDGKNLFKCEECDFSSRYRGSFKQHLLRKHQKILEEDNLN